MLKQLASRLPKRLQQELKRLHFGGQIRKQTFVTDEPEFALLDAWIRPGDWAVDVGANVGHYTCRLANLVGPSGRVFAFEPIPPTFELLTANVARSAVRNVTLVNAAASESTGIVGMSLPQFDSGLNNYYMASVTPSSDHAQYHVVAFRVDDLHIGGRVTLVKVDAEGHELPVLRGMEALLRRSQPRLIVEGADSAVESYLRSFSYRFETLPDSPNRVYSAA